MMKIQWLCVINSIFTSFLNVKSYYEIKDHDENLITLRKCEKYTQKKMNFLRRRKEKIMLKEEKYYEYIKDFLLISINIKSSCLIHFLYQLPTF